jgi:hypothetical protein
LVWCGCSRGRAHHELCLLQQATRLLAVCARVLHVCSCACTPLLQIEDARVIMDRENPFRSRGFGFVTFARPEDAETAIKNNHDKEWQVLCVLFCGECGGSKETCALKPARATGLWKGC